MIDRTALNNAVDRQDLSPQELALVEKLIDEYGYQYDHLGNAIGDARELLLSEARNADGSYVYPRPPAD